jgi:hypothetical protein
LLRVLDSCEEQQHVAGHQDVIEPWALPSKMKESLIRWRESTGSIKSGL